MSCGFIRMTEFLVTQTESWDFHFCLFIYLFSKLEYGLKALK